MSRVLDQLTTVRLGNRLWLVSEDFRVGVGGFVYRVPAGFVTDGASCPRALWSLCSPVAGPFGEGAVWHDFMYNEGAIATRELADNGLYELGRYRGAGVIRANLVLQGVRAFGGASFKTGKSKLTRETCYDYNKAYAVVKETRARNIFYCYKEDYLLS